MTCTRVSYFSFGGARTKITVFLLVCLQSVINTVQFITAQCTLIFKAERIEQETSRSSSKERNKEIECLSLLSQGQRYTYRVLQTIQMEVILLCVWAEPAVLGSAKTALEFKYKI